MIFYRLFKFFDDPYPFYEDWRQGLKLCLAIGIFIALFCYLFRPFGLEELSDLGLIGYGVVSFLVCFLYMVLLPLIFPKQLSHDGWKVYKEIIWILLINITLAFSNYFYTGFIFEAGYEFRWRIFLFILTCTLIIAAIPAVAIILYKQVFVYKRIVKEVEKIDEQLIRRRNLFVQTNDKELVFHSTNKDEDLHIFEKDFIVLAASGNYLEIYHLDGNELKKTLIRNKISEVESALKSSTKIIRCHRSYLINLDKIIKVYGNLQGYKLVLKGIEFQAPVSRRYTKLIKSKIGGSPSSK